MQTERSRTRMPTFVAPGDVPAVGGMGRIPSARECRDAWSELDMPEHIQEHSLLVARVALHITQMARDRFLPQLNCDLVTAAALLHDIAKMYTIRHGGSHSQLGAAWVQQRTGNALLARAILHHVHWPFAMDVRRYPVSLIVFYSDKRVRHAEIVGMGERFNDLSLRYGTTPVACEHIQLSLEQGRAVEVLLEQELKVDLNAYSFDCGRMV
jgi:putative nucleotidyltransferase with HDIG domain